MHPAVPYAAGMLVQAAGMLALAAGTWRQGSGTEQSDLLLLLKEMFKRNF